MAMLAIFEDLRNLLLEAAGKRKQMVIMVGGPASGKGFFLGEGGKGLPKSTKNLFSADEIPDEKVGFAESDNNLRGIQYFESIKHYETLKKAADEGPDALKKALDDHWYKTKDGKKVDLKNMGLPPVPDPHDKFYKKTGAFYKNMRGWHNDADETNPETGKPKERFKDQARKVFEEETAKKIEHEDKDFMIIDSAGEDIDAQDFEGQIARGKAAGFEVSVVFLDIEKEDTKLSNMSRGFVAGKRMVDEQDIDNFFDKHAAAIEKIKKAAPNRFLHFKRRPPLTEKERAELAGAMTHTPDGKPTFLADPSSSVRSIKDLPADQAKAVEKKVKSLLYKPQYELDTESSFSDSGKDFPAHSFGSGEEVQAVKAGNETLKDIAKDLKKTVGKDDEKGGAAPAKVDMKDKSPAAKAADKKKLTPDQYRSKWGRCPAGWNYSKDKRHCLDVRSLRAHKENLMESAPPNLKTFMGKVLKRVERKLPEDIRGYKLSSAVAGFNVVVTLPGARGDVSAIRELRAPLKKAMERAVRRMSNGTIKEVRVTASNKGDDLLVLAEVIFP
jgi:hypothetical protein